MATLECVTIHAERLARALAISSDDPRIREVTRLAWSWVREGERPRRAVEMASVLVFRQYGQDRRAG